MMPPKKSRAAREHHEATADIEAPPDNVSDEVSEETPVVNIFSAELMIGKRKRQLPPGEQHLKDWLGKHFEEKEELRVNISDAYDAYLQSCTETGAFAVEQGFMMRVMKEIFSSGIAVKEDSSIKEDIRQKKAKKKSDQVKAPSLQLKMKDIIEETLKEMENPMKGVSFRIIKQHIAGNYPALRLDIRPKKLKSALERGVYAGAIELVRGIGMAGIYRLPGPGKETVEKKKSHKKKSESENKENADGNATENGEADDTDEKGDGDAEAKHEHDGEKDEMDKDAKPKKSKNKKHKKKAAKPKVVVYSDPHRLEDIFAMAMTFQMEPKEASLTKIRNYILRYYKDNLTIDSLMRCMDTGEGKGFWARVSGQGGSGSFRLDIDEFDPTDDDDLTGQVVNAILACTEPKLSSSGVLKKYILDFHPEFHVAERPILFKKAIERSISRGYLRQLTGIGLTGTFQLTKPFTPSPAALQGKDTASDYEVSSDEAAEFEAPNVSQFMDAYKPRPTKRHSRKSAAGVARLEYEIHVPKKVHKGSGRKVAGRKTKGKKAASKKSKYVDDSSEDESSEEESEDSSSEEEAPAPTPRRTSTPVKKRTPAKAPAKSKAKSPAKGRGKPKARGGGGRSARGRGKVTPVAKQKAEESASDASDEQDDEEEDVPAPKKGQSKGKGSTPTGRRQSNVSYIELSDGESDVDEF